MNLKEQKKEIKNPELSVITGKENTAGRQNSQRPEEIDLLELGLVLFDKFRYILFFGLLGALIMNAFAFFCIKPTYESTAKMYVVSASDDSVVDLTDLNIGTSLTKDYEDLMLSYPVLEQVIDQLHLDETYEGFTYEDLAEMITITNTPETRILQVTAVSTDPQISSDIANAMVNVAIDYLPKTMSTEEPNIAQVARPAIRKSAPSYLKFLVMGGLLGGLLCCAYITVRHLMDDTIHTAEEMEKYFGITPLTVIPDIESIRNADSKNNKRGNRRR